MRPRKAIVVGSKLSDTPTPAASAGRGGVVKRRASRGGRQRREGGPMCPPDLRLAAVRVVQFASHCSGVVRCLDDDRHVDEVRPLTGWTVDEEARLERPESRDGLWAPGSRPSRRPARKERRRARRALDRPPGRRPFRVEARPPADAEAGQVGPRKGPEFDESSAERRNGSHVATLVIRASKAEADLASPAGEPTAALLVRFPDEPGDRRRRHYRPRLSSGLSFRCASRARSSAALAP
jgi:hypothetical protein